MLYVRLKCLAGFCLAKILISLFLFSSVYAHELRPVVVDISESKPSVFNTFLKFPASIPANAGPSLLFPEHCYQLSQKITAYDGDGYYTQQEYKCDKDLAGAVIRIIYPQVNPSLNSLLQVRFLTGEEFSRLLKPGEAEWTIPAREEFSIIAMEYFSNGVIHIFAGFDHLLFLICLVFIAGTTGKIIITVTGFTIAHSITLALSTLSVIDIPVTPVDAIIALSIVFLANELIMENKNSWTWRYPLIISFIFGMLHGLGFSSALNSLGLPQTELIPALLFFNLGVEAGQIFFILCFILIHTLSRRISDNIFKNKTIFTMNRFAAYIAGSTGCYLLLLRVQSF